MNLPIRSLFMTRNFGAGNRAAALSGLPPITRTTRGQQGKHSGEGEFGVSTGQFRVIRTSAAMKKNPTSAVRFRPSRNYL